MQNMLQHHSVFVPARGRDHQSLSRLAQGEGRLVLHREVCCHDPIYVIAEGSWFGFARVLGSFTIACAASPQWDNVFIGQIHFIS